MALKHRVVIASHRPWVRWSLIAGAMAALALGAWGLYSYTRATTVTDFEKARTERDQLLEDRRRLTRDLRQARSEIEDLQAQNVYLERSREMDQQASDEVKQSLASLQAEVSDLREQVAFYRGIVSPDASRAGVRIYEFKVSATSVERVFRYDLVLVQSVRQDRRSSGRIEIRLKGLANGAPQTLMLAGSASTVPLKFSFKYFEEFSGEFRLPAGFEPLNARVEVLPDSGDTRIEDEFEWSKLIPIKGE